MLKNLKTHGDLHIARKLFHVSTLLFIFFCILWLPTWFCWILYALVGVPMILIDYGRRYSPALNKLFLKVLGPFLRKHEARKVSGSTFAALGVALTYALFPRPISLLAILFLAVGDPTASLFGLLFGKTKIMANKSLAGTVAAFVVCTLATGLFFLSARRFFDFNVMGSPLLIALVCGSIGAISELLVIFKIDDNLTQPLVSALLLSLLFWQLGGVQYG